MKTTVDEVSQIVSQISHLSSNSAVCFMLRELWLLISNNVINYNVIAKPKDKS